MKALDQFSGLQNSSRFLQLQCSRLTIRTASRESPFLPAILPFHMSPHISLCKNLTRRLPSSSLSSHARLGALVHLSESTLLAPLLLPKYPQRFHRVRRASRESRNPARLIGPSLLRALIDKRYFRKGRVRSALSPASANYYWFLAAISRWPDPIRPTARNLGSPPSAAIDCLSSPTYSAST